VYSFKDGSVYEGEWKEDVQHGYGKLKTPNGIVYEGQWNNDDKDGPGILHTPIGKVNQVWQMGVLVSPGFVKIEEPMDA
jgi:lysozyme